MCGVVGVKSSRYCRQLMMRERGGEVLLQRLAAVHLKIGDVKFVCESSYLGTSVCRRVGELEQELTTRLAEVSRCEASYAALTSKLGIDHKKNLKIKTFV